MHKLRFCGSKLRLICRKLQLSFEKRKISQNKKNPGTVLEHDTGIAAGAGTPAAL